MSIDEAYLQSLMRTVSHDMGGTLRGSVGFSSLLLEDYSDVLDEKAIKWLSLIKRDSELTQNKLVALSRYARLYDVEEPFDECDLTQLCNRAFEFSGIKEAYPSFDISIGALDVVVGCERLWIELFVELINNAAIHGGSDNPLRCEIYSYTLGDTRFIVVSDNGRGLSDVQKKIVAKPFKTLETQNAHVGMGLAIVKRIAEIHSGSLVLKDNEPETPGLQVVISLPLDDNAFH